MEENDPKGDNPFKKLEPKNEEPRPELKKAVMKRIGFKEVLGDLLGLFTIKFGESAKDMIDKAEDPESDQKR